MLDPSAFEEIYRTHYRAVLQYAQRRIADPEAARDVCAETFAIAWQKSAQLDVMPLPWLLRTASYVLKNLYRRNARERRLQRDLEDVVRIERETRHTVELNDALAALGPKDQEALRLTYWEGLSAADVGAVLGCSEAAAWKRISRAKTALRASLRLKEKQSVLRKAEGVTA